MLPIDVMVPSEPRRAEYSPGVGVVRENSGASGMGRAESGDLLPDERLRAGARQAPVGVFVTDALGTCEFVNERWSELTGIPPPDAVGKNWRAVLPHDDAPEAAGRWRSLLAEGDEFEQRYRLRRPDGSARWVREHARPLRDDEGSVCGFVGTLSDITELRETEEELRASEARLQGAVDTALDAVVTIDAGGFVTGWNPQAEAIFGWPLEEARGRRIDHLVMPERYRARHREALRRYRETGRTTYLSRRVELEALRHDGSEFPIELAVTPVNVGGHISFSAFIRDISELKEAEAELARRALHDPLTGVANRELFFDRLGQALARRLRHDATVAVLFVDVDDLKKINDVHGHDVGDRVLVSVAQRLRSVLRPSDTVARLGGDEFAVVLPDLPGPDPAVQVAERVEDAVAEPAAPSGMVVSVSIGIAFARDVGEGPEDVLRNADRAMYIAKKHGGSGFEIYGSLALEAYSKRFDTEAALRNAFDHGELALAFQPVVDLRSDTVSGLEALVRWNRPGHGTLPAGAFISIAEESGLVDEIDRWVLTNACRQAATWHEVLGDASPQLHVNVSARQAERPGLVEDVARALGAADLPPSALCLELTEEGLGLDPEPALRRVNRLADVGVSMVIDDFGRGLSSLALLERLPIAGLKVGRDFVEGLGRDPARGGVVRAAIAVARSLALTVTAEGIERQEQRMVLVALGCHRGQGYLFAPPLDSGTVERVLEHAASTRGDGVPNLHASDLRDHRSV